MKIKYAFMVFLAVLMLLSLSQVFPLPPFAGDIHRIFKSGYFMELERGFEVIKDSFIEIKMMSKPVYSWLFLDDIRKKHGIDVRVYSAQGYEVRVPGDTRESGDPRVEKLRNSLRPMIISEVDGGRYYSAVPVFAEDRCRFCHRTPDKKGLIGILTFEREQNSYIYYSSTRVIIFTCLSLILSMLFYLVWIWDPERKVKELFDK